MSVCVLFVLSVHVDQLSLLAATRSSASFTFQDTVPFTMPQAAIRPNVVLGGSAADASMKRTRSGRMPRVRRGNAGPRATLDLGALAKSINGNDKIPEVAVAAAAAAAAPPQPRAHLMSNMSPADALAAADRPDAHRRGVQQDSGLSKAVELGVAPGAESAQARHGGISYFGSLIKSFFSKRPSFSRNAGMSASTTRLDTRSTAPAGRKASFHGNAAYVVDGSAPMASTAGATAPGIQSDHDIPVSPTMGEKRRSARLSGLLLGRREERATAASSLGSLQSYAQTTVKDSGPFQGCFNNSTSEVVPVKRFTRQTREQATLRQSDNLAQSQSRSQRLGRSGSVTNRHFQSEFASDDYALVFSEEVRRNGLLSRRPERFEYPNFALAEYGAPNTWNSDVFVLLHNAIRWEAMDMYTILTSLERRWLALTLLDMYEFAEYWETFELFLGQWFEVEDQIMFPYLLSVAASSEELARYYKSAKYNKDKLVGMLYDIGATIEMFNSAPAGEVFPALYRQLVDYVPKILDYMAQQDAVLPPIFAAHCHPEDRIMLNRAIANFLIRAANGRDSIAILTRWIEDSMVLQIWKDENLSTRAKSSHKKWLTKLDENHVEIARQFQRRLRNGKPSNHLKDEVEGPTMPDRPRDRATSPHFSPVTM